MDDPRTTTLPRSFRGALTIVLLAVASLLGGCPTDEHVDRLTWVCNATLACGDGWTCQYGLCVEDSSTCVPPCNAGAYCDEGQCVGVTCSDGMCLVPAGTSLMGCSPLVQGEACPAYAETLHEVSLPSFYIDQHEVLAMDYELCVADGSCVSVALNETTMDECTVFADDVMTLPMNCASYGMAVMYCEYAGKRLCTEAEWEKAARGLDGRPYPWGSNTPSCDTTVVGIVDGVSCGYVAPVDAAYAGSFASPFAIVGMDGNVSEWTYAYYDELFYSQGPALGLSPDEEAFVLRGGNFMDSSPLAPTTYDRFVLPVGVTRPPYTGIRCCMDAP